MYLGLVYQHFKGNYYEVLGEALDVSTKKPVIIYKPLYDCEHKMFVRDKEEFFGNVVSFEDKMEIPRFKRVKCPECLS